MQVEMNISFCLETLIAEVLLYSKPWSCMQRKITPNNQAILIPLLGISEQTD
jgi:hypothetical protein